MIIDLTRRGLLAGAAAAIAASAYADDLVSVAVGYIDRADDPLYAQSRGYEGLLPGRHVSPYAGAALAVADAAMVGQAVGVGFSIARTTLEENDDAFAALQKLIASKQVPAAIVDLPEDETHKLAKAASGLPLVLINARHKSVDLRAKTCPTQLFHTMPSWDMLEDALAQVLVKRDWLRVLLIDSDDPADKSVSAAFQASAAKFGLTIVAAKVFVPGEDPRERDKNNARLMTADVDCDVIFVADRQGDFARGLPFNTFPPRPVVGASGLTPSAWNGYWDRDGAAQLQHRFYNSAKRPMSELDWTAWVGVRAVVETAVRRKARSAADIAAALGSQDLTLELYKGVPGSFRPWNRQLRQPILLATDQAVLAVAPVEGMLHRTNQLDTLGLDEPEFHCK